MFVFLAVMLGVRGPPTERNPQSIDFRTCPTTEACGESPSQGRGKTPPSRRGGAREKNLSAHGQPRSQPVASP